jgi:hypothetical protein
MFSPDVVYFTGLRKTILKFHALQVSILHVKSECSETPFLPSCPPSYIILGTSQPVSEVIKAEKAASLDML